MGHETWTLPKEQAAPLIRQAVESGINFFDTANVYSAGDSETLLGQVLREVGRRDELVIASKVWAPVASGPNRSGLSRKAILTEIDHSLRRLGVDHLDLYQVHRWDPLTPIEETMQALHDVVRSGKARYLGASSMAAWQFAKAQHVADLHGWTRFVSMQDHLNLLYREEEREMIPLCVDMGVGVIPWSPLARGKLTRPWAENTERSLTDKYVTSLYDDSDKTIVDRVGQLAQRRGVSRAQIALAWVANQSAITAPILGATKPGHLSDAIAALSISLEPSETRLLEERYRPREVRYG